MRSYWLLDQHGVDGPVALVETDGRMRVSAVVRFGPSATELDEQQRIWDLVIGGVVPTMKPFVDAASVDEEGTAPHPDLRRDGTQATTRAARPGASRRQAGRAGGTKTNKGARGDR